MQTSNQIIYSKICHFHSIEGIEHTISLWRSSAWAIPDSKNRFTVWRLGLSKLNNDNEVGDKYSHHLQQNT